MLVRAPSTQSTYSQAYFISDRLYKSLRLLYSDKFQSENQFQSVILYYYDLESDITLSFYKDFRFPSVTLYKISIGDQNFQITICQGIIQVDTSKPVMQYIGLTAVEVPQQNYDECSHVQVTGKIMMSAVMLEEWQYVIIQCQGQRTFTVLLIVNIHLQ